MAKKTEPKEPAAPKLTAMEAQLTTQVGNLLGKVHDLTTSGELLKKERDDLREMLSRQQLHTTTKNTEKNILKGRVEGLLLAITLITSKGKELSEILPNNNLDF